VIFIVILRERSDTPASERILLFRGALGFPVWFEERKIHSSLHRKK
jgi:hypothetical protein